MNAAAENLQDRCDHEEKPSTVHGDGSSLLSEIRELREEHAARLAGAPDSSALFAELRAQVVEARRERDEWRDTARLLGEVLGRYTTWRRCRLAALLWRSARSRRLRERLHDAEVAAEQGVLVARDLEERLRAERAAGMEVRADLLVQAGHLVAARASLVEAATFARGVVGKCDCLTCSPSQQLAERWERQARGTEASRG